MGPSQARHRRSDRQPDGRGSLCVTSPPLIITKEQVDSIVNTLREAIPPAYAEAEKMMADLEPAQ